MTLRIMHCIALAAVTGLCLPCAAQDRASDRQPHRVAGEKLDSGLAELAHYREWRHTWISAAPQVPPRMHAIAGEKRDSGLGELLPRSVARVE